MSRKHTEEEIYVGIIAMLRSKGYSKEQLEYGIKKIPDSLVIDFDKNEDIIKLIHIIEHNIRLHTLN